MSAREAVKETNQSAYLVRARKVRRCEGFRCTHQIEPGEDYVRAVCFPGHDANDGTRPWVLHICVTCATEFGGPLPPRRTTTVDPQGIT